MQEKKKKTWYPANPGILGIVEKDLNFNIGHRIKGKYLELLFMSWNFNFLCGPGNP